MKQRDDEKDWMRKRNRGNEESALDSDDMVLNKSPVVDRLDLHAGHRTALLSGRGVDNDTRKAEEDFGEWSINSSLFAAGGGSRVSSELKDTCCTLIAAYYGEEEKSKCNTVQFCVEKSVDGKNSKLSTNLNNSPLNSVWHPLRLIPRAVCHCLVLNFSSFVIVLTVTTNKTKNKSKCVCKFLLREIIF